MLINHYASILTHHASKKLKIIIKKKTNMQNAQNAKCLIDNPIKKSVCNIECNV